MTMNMFSKETGMLNPALRPDGYDAISAQLVASVTNCLIIRKGSKGEIVDLTPAALKFVEDILVSLGVRATSDSMARYSVPKLALLKAVSPPGLKKIG